MSTVRTKNVIKLSADNDTISGPVDIEAILFIAGTTSPSAQLKITDTNGAILWESGVAADNARLQDNVGIRIQENETLHCDMAGTGTRVYLYLGTH